jgi:PHD/YefM family antitoxin component YafN of YafNO toxin-antitoxin module
MSQTSTYTASQTRDNLFRLIKKTASGLIKPEITLKGSDPVIMISKAEYESWMETLSITQVERQAALEPINQDELTDIKDI